MDDSSPPPHPVTSYFSGLAEDYAAYRPSYPPAAIEAMLEGLPNPVRAADVGCGTGISTRLLAEAGAQVIGLDPNADMLAAAKSGTHEQLRIEWLLGEAESTKLADGSVDLVLCAQAYHWFDPDAALQEFHRILRPHGHLALMWNVRDTSDAFSEGYERLVEAAQDDARQRGRVVKRNRSHALEGGDLFGHVRHLVFQNPHEMDWSHLLGRARSASYFPPSGPVRDQIERQLRALFEQHEQDGVVILRQRTELTLGEGL